MFRKSLKSIVLATAIATVSIPAAGALDVEKLTFPPLGKIDMPEVERIELSNGMVLMLVEDHELPLVHFRARIRAGGVYETEGKAALTNVFSEVQRTGGTKSMTGDEIDEAVERIGAAVETSLGPGSGNVYARCLADQVDTVLSIFADVLTHPEFRQDKIDLAKTQLRSVIARRNDQPFGIMDREFNKLVYGSDSPRALQVEYDDVDALDREDLQAFHRRYYHPNAVILGVWGDFGSAAMRKKIEKTFSSWPKASIDYPKKAEVTQVTPGSIHYIEKTDIEQSFILIGHLGVRWDNPDLPKIRLMNAILGASSFSRMVNKVRFEKGLAYATGGEISPGFDHPGLFYSYSTTKHSTAHETLTTMLKVIQTLQDEGITDDELSLAKENYLNSFVFSFDSTGEVVNRLMTYEYFGYPSDFLQNFRKKVESVTREQIAEVARGYIHRDDLIMLVIGDKGRFDRPLSSFGKVARIDITIQEPK
jgi:zinc protease